MARGALYYPYIEVPSDPWFTRVLLYWDVAGAIVPESLEHDLDEIGARGRDLNRAGLLEFIPPDEYAPDRLNYGRNFVEVLEQDADFVGKRRLALAHGAHERLHETKADAEVFNELKHHEVARKGQGNWWEVESQIAELYMAGLAVVLGKCRAGRASRASGFQGVEMDAVCDRRSRLDVFTQERPVPLEAAPALFPDHYEDRKDEFRTEIIELLLPAPSNEVPVSELADFKRLHKTLLTRFRADIESRAIEVAREGDPRIRRDLTSTIREKLDADLNEVEAKMRERGWETDPIGSALCMALPVVGAAIDAATGSPLTFTSAASPLALAVWQTLRRPGKADRKEPLAYAAAARKAFG